MRKGRSAAFMRNLRRKYGLGEFNRKTGTKRRKRIVSATAAKRAARKRGRNPGAKRLFNTRNPGNYFSNLAKGSYTFDLGQPEIRPYHSPNL